MLNAFTLAEYKRQRKLGWQARIALIHAKTWDRWTNAENEGLVQIKVMPDDTGAMEFDDPRDAKLANEEGVFGILGQYRAADDLSWETADSVWGFIGDSYKDSGYDFDVMAQTLTALEKLVPAYAEHWQDAPHTH